MTGNEYQAKALRTENKDMSGVVERLTPDVVGQLRVVISCLTSNCVMLDDIKKWLYYGKVAKSKISEHRALTIDTDERSLRMLHSVLGLATEVGEVAELYRDKQLTVENILNEYGDIAWYLAQGLDAGDVRLDSCLVYNVLKLTRRYPDKFDAEKAQEHDGH